MSIYKVTTNELEQNETTKTNLVKKTVNQLLISWRQFPKHKPLILFINVLFFSTL